jgi:hypothetical protein
MSSSCIQHTFNPMSWAVSVVRAATSWLTTCASAEATIDNVKVKVEQADEGNEESQLSSIICSVGERLATSESAEAVSVEAREELVDEGGDESFLRTKISSAVVSPEKPAEQASRQCDDDHGKRVTRKRSLDVFYRDLTSSDEQSRDSSNESSYEHSEESGDDSSFQTSVDSGDTGQSLKQVVARRKTEQNSTYEVAAGCETKQIRLYPLQREIDAAR